MACSIRIFQLHPRFFKLYFLKQVVTRKRAYPTRDCDNLPGPTYLQLTDRHTRSKLPILPNPIFKNMAKQAYQHIHSTILMHNTRAQKPTLGKASRDASDTRAWHATFIL